MPTFQIICLANSDKRGGRCIAGLKTDGSGWLRPVSRRPDGDLRIYDYILPDNREPELFEIISFDCVGPSPKYYQPENWLLDSGRWRSVGTASYSLITTVLGAEFKRSSALENLFGDESDRIEAEFLRQNPVEQSLVYIKPEDICWVVKDYSGGRKCRAVFKFKGSEYDLSITDPKWKAYFNQDGQDQFQPGTYDCDEVIDRLGLTEFTPDGFRFTLSLGEPFTKVPEEPAHCYKLIAAVINVGILLNGT